MLLFLPAKVTLDLIPVLAPAAVNSMSATEKPVTAVPAETGKVYVSCVSVFAEFTVKVFPALTTVVAPVPVITTLV